MAVQTDKQGTPDAKQDTPATVADRLAAAPETLFADGSKIADAKGYTDAFTRMSETLTGYTSAMLAAGEATRLGAEANMDLRLSIRRSDNAAPDFLGNTDAYSFAKQTLMVAFATEHGLSESDLDAYNVRVRAYMSDHATVQSAMAVYA